MRAASDVRSTRSHHFHEASGVWYAYANVGDGGRRQRELMHRVVMGLTKDGDGLNNTRENLRLATTSQNAMNRRKRAAASSRYKGVSFHKNNRTHPWRASIFANGRAVYLGFFATEEEAAKAYDAASRELHGEFGCQNDSVASG